MVASSPVVGWGSCAIESEEAVTKHRPSASLLSRKRAVAGVKQGVVIAFMLLITLNCQNVKSQSMPGARTQRHNNAA